MKVQHPDMKKEDLIYSMADIDDSFIDEAMPGKKVQKKETGVVVPVKRGMSKAAVAAAIALCVVVLGGGVVWAMTASPLKDYFFADSKEQAFADVYKDIGKTYKIGDHSGHLTILYMTNLSRPDMYLSAQYHYGFILDADEKVSVIIDGKEYK